MFKIMLTLFLAGLLFGSGPCIASCGPFLISYIAGARKDITKTITVYVLFSLARICVYAALALAIFFLSRIAVEGLLRGFYKYVLILGGAFIITIGLFMAFAKRLDFSRFLRDPVWAGKFCRGLHKHILEHDAKSIVAVGLIIGLLPCAPLISILSYIGLISRTWNSSLLYALSFGIGTFVSPLILLVVIAGVVPRILLYKKESYYRIFSLICGIVIVFLGIQLIRRAF